MITVIGERAVFFDCDNTLVFSCTEYPNIKSGTQIKIGGRDFYVHEQHVAMIMDFKARGHKVIIWSQGGPSWAEKIVCALELQAYVDLVIPKPDWYFDDKKTDSWMPDKHRYFKPIEGYEHE